MKNPKRSQPATEPQKEVVVRLRVSMPRFQRARDFFANHRQKVIVASGVTIALLLSGFGIHLALQQPDTADSPSPTDQAAAHFTPLIPQSDTDPQYRFDADTQVLSYHTDYDDARLTISQQPAPDNLHTDSEQLDQIAQYLGAEEAVASAKGTVYIASDEESNEQTVFFATEETLVFIQSQQLLTNQQWRQYVEDLEP